MLLSAQLFDGKKDTVFSMNGTVAPRPSTRISRVTTVLQTVLSAYLTLLVVSNEVFCIDTLWHGYNHHCYTLENIFHHTVNQIFLEDRACNFFRKILANTLNMNEKKKTTNITEVLCYTYYTYYFINWWR